MASPICVRSVEEEDAVLGRCRCGQRWALAAEDVVPLRGRWYDALVLRCVYCGSSHNALFDITAFFEPPSHAWLNATA